MKKVKISLGKHYKFSTLGFLIEVKAVKILENNEEVEAEMVKIIEEEDLDSSKELLEGIKNLINKHHIMKVQKNALMNL